MSLSISDFLPVVINTQRTSGTRPKRSPGPTRIFGATGAIQTRSCVVGHSAGAYLAALVASDGKYLAKYDLSTTNIRGVAPISGQFRIDLIDLKQDVEITFPGRRDLVWGTDTEGYVAASPNTYLRADTPPVLFLDADSDLERRREMSEEIAAELRDAGQPNSVAKEVANSDHFSIHSELGKSDDEATDLILNFMKGILETQ